MATTFFPASPVVNYRKAIGDHKTTAVKKLQHIPKQLAMLDDQEPLDQPTIQKEKKIEKIRGATVLHVDSRGKLPDDPSLTTASREYICRPGEPADLEDN
ncbi:hypothetical protein HCDG_05094 [Histoplasma capsulatum H143]|uniref:Uncharacterized protein n=1 Tax=Ajellomyces capsulatus (strain H143) TaxID=544712 RepID=C6HGK3_AJECH|nr:hypothetical protein HCDG_05094 [Histoplasma capsulatum H143]